ncbi:L-asparaginase [hydrothermal vent metagenome]|uniref:L-asparaginase n=1 Tax=hydrothermal vent metagenome TaxID=652676 RepID=A0A1W1EFV5_9ZZZZ
MKNLIKKSLAVLLIAMPMLLSAAAKLPHVVIVTTGGTVAMKLDAKTGALVPAVSGKDLIEAVPGLGKIATIETVEFCNIDSSKMTPTIWRDLSEKVDSILAREDVTGVVVTHGTDTMEDGVFFLQTTLKSEKTVAFVGAQRSASDLSADGPANIFDAVMTVVSPDSKGWGAVLVMDQYINGARYVQKTHTTNPHTFMSGQYGYLGYVVNNKVMKFNDVLKVEKLALPKKMAYVPTFYTFPGDNGSAIKHAVDDGAKGIAVAGLGAGNVGVGVAEAIEYALSKDIPVVIGTRVFEGGVYPMYGGAGGGSSLMKAGAVLSKDLGLNKARLLLQIAVSNGMTKEEIVKLFN